jgi:DNA processing protein
MTVSQAERLARVSLSRLAEPGDPRLANLVAELGAVRVHQHLAAERDLGGVLSDVATRLRRVDARRDLENAWRLSIRFVVPGDDEWPTVLDQLQFAPPLHGRGGVPLGLWVRGSARLNELERSVAIVGSRSATTYGANVSAELAAGAVQAGFSVVSGAAFGIDQAAHRGALGGARSETSAGVPTLAVLACGADRVYPAAHKALLDHIAEVGAVISEAPPGCAPTKLRFLSRNRVIAGLCRGTVVVEAAVRSGALNTATWTQRLLRPVMGVPGPVTSAPSQGVHELLRSGAATVVTSGADVLEVVSGSGENLVESRRGETRRSDRLTLRQRQVLDAVPVTRGAAADSISRAAGIGLVEVRAALTRLATVGLAELTESGWRLTSAARSG